MSRSSRVLLIEDDAGIADTLQRVLAAEHYEVVVKHRGDEGLAFAREQPVNAVVADLRLPGMDGLELTRQLHAIRPHLPIILTTAFGTTDTAIEATKFGAYDYLLKPFEMPDFIALVRKAVDSNRLMSEPVELGISASGRDALVGRSAIMQSIYKEIGRVASKPVSVLIRGETGTGKELIARALYQHSDRAEAPFIAVNCAAIPETLLESELFGHERGAFTGAENRRIGRFEQANHGTLLLDEIGDMTPGTQSKLLRMLQEQCLQRVGGKESIPVDVRVIAATHRDLESAIGQKQFREDLYYRLSVVVITLPPLRRRQEDIPELVRYFLQKHGPTLGFAQPSIQSAALAFMQQQPWPGNVRQLENVTRNALLLSQGYPVTVDHAQTALKQAALPAANAGNPLGDYIEGLLVDAERGVASNLHAQVIATAERELYARAINRAGGNQARAARWLGISRMTMNAKLQQYGLHPNKSPDGG